MTLDQATVVDGLLAWVAPDRADTAAAADVRSLVADWAREADSMPDPLAVLEFQREDLEAAADALGGDRTRAVRLTLLRRRLDRLAARTLSLGKAVVGGQVDDAEARRSGEELLAECEQMRGEVDAVGDAPGADALRASLADSMLDAVYAIERKAMSLRLAHAAGQDGAPSVR